jgi:hypothetical protein
MTSQTRPAPRSTTPKPAYHPHIRKEADGVYTIPSQTYTYPLYTLHVAADGHVSCSCPAGARGRVCKHARLIAGLVAYNAHPTHIRPVVAETAPALPAPIDLASRRRPAPAFVPAIDALAELFS